ncbi:MAG: hypothetical protein HQK54_13845, partial [Oligoflexales bacterium]|nr:hypothetical protein [Oligoflexales bacterium]
SIFFLEGEGLEWRLSPMADTIEEEIGNFLLSLHRQFEEKRDFLKVVLERMIIDTTLKEKVDASIARRVLQNLQDRLLKMRERGLVRTDVDLEKVSLSILSYSFSISGTIKLVANFDESYLISTINEFSRYISRGLSPLPA